MQAASTRPSELRISQMSTLRFFAEFVAKHGYPPTYREIGDRFGIKSTNAVNGRLHKLERRGFLTQAGGAFKSRAWRLTPAGWDVVGGRSALGSAATITGYCDPPSARCGACQRVFFGKSFEGHRCSADDLRRVG